MKAKDKIYLVVIFILASVSTYFLFFYATQFIQKLVFDNPSNILFIGVSEHAFSLIVFLADFLFLFSLTGTLIRSSLLWLNKWRRNLLMTIFFSIFLLSNIIFVFTYTTASPDTLTTRSIKTLFTEKTYLINSVSKIRLTLEKGVTTRRLERPLYELVIGKNKLGNLYNKLYDKDLLQLKALHKILKEKNIPIELNEEYSKNPRRDIVGNLLKYLEK